MGYLLINRLNVLEKARAANRIAGTHILTNKEYKEIEPQLEGWTGTNSITVEYTTQEVNSETGEPAGTLKKLRLQHDDVLIIDDLDDLEN